VDVSIPRFWSEWNSIMLFFFCFLFFISHVFFSPSYSGLQIMCVMVCNLYCFLNEICLKYDHDVKRDLACPGLYIRQGCTCCHYFASKRTRSNNMVAVLLSCRCRYKKMPWTFHVCD
jgi:hypothetical protein